MSFVYGETARATKASLTAHLRECVACRKTVADWQNARRGLGEWQLTAPAASKQAGTFVPIVKWGLAAMVVIGLGYTLGRVSAARADNEVLRVSLVNAVKRQVQDEFRADWQAVLADAPEALNTNFRRQLRSDLDQWSARAVAASSAESQRLMLSLADTCNAARQRDQQALLTAFDRAEQKHQAEHMSLRRAVETVAVVADDKFQRTATQLGELVSYAEARFIPDASSTSFQPLTH
jgi:hypothetical protein